MKSGELKALNRLQSVTGGKIYDDQSDWTVRTGKQGMYYLHKSSGLAFQTLGAAKVALSALAHTCTANKDVVDEDDGREEVLSIASGLDQVVSQLHKQLDMLEQYKEAPEADQTRTLQLQQPKIVDMWDVCGYVEVDKDSMMLQQKDTLLQRSTKLRCQLLLATCAVFAQKLLHNSSYTSGYRQHCMYTLLQELKRSGADNPALAMLVEPLLPRPWRRELDRQKLLKGDEDTDLYSPVLAAQDLQAASAEKGPPLEDDFVVVESPELLKLTCKVKKVSEALDLVPLYHRAQVERAVADGLAAGLEAMAKCLTEFQERFAEQEHHQDWLHALRQALTANVQDTTLIANSLKDEASSSKDEVSVENGVADSI